MKRIITHTVQIDMEDLLQTLKDDLSNEEIVELIKRLDHGMEDWDSTMELCGHFKELEMLYHTESPEAV